MAVWIAFALPVIAAFGAYLKVHTHHRGLGGATFAVFAMTMAGVTALLAKRARGSAQWLVSRGAGAWVVRLASAV